MKKSILAALVLALALSAAGCSQSADDKTEPKNTNVTETAAPGTGTQGTANQTEANQTETNQLDGVNDFADSADENVDMDAVGGEYLKVSDESTGSPSAELGVFSVEIKSAKAFQYNGGDYLVAEIEFENNSSVETTYASVIDTKAFQDGMQIAPASLPESIEGIETATSAQKVPGGEKITVQKLFKLLDTDTPVEIQLHAFYEDTEQFASQIFNIQ